MKTIAILLTLSVPAFGQWQRSERIFEVPQPPVRVRQYVPQDVDVPQPPLRYKEVTEVRQYTVPLDEPPVTYQAAPVYRAAPVYATPVYAAPVMYAVPVVYAKVPVAEDRYGLFGLRAKVYYSDGTSVRTGPVRGRR